MLLFEIGIHPDLIEWNYGEQWSAGRNVLTDLHIAPGHVAGLRRTNRGALFSQISGEHLRLCLQHQRMMFQIGADDQCPGGRKLLLGSFERSTSRVQTVLCMSYFLGRYGSILHGRSSLIIIFRARKINFSGIHIRLKLRDVVVELADFTHGITQGRLGLLQNHACVTVVENHDKLTFSHQIGVIRIDGENRAANQRG